MRQRESRPGAANTKGAMSEEQASTLNNPIIQPVAPGATSIRPTPLVRHFDGTFARPARPCFGHYDGNLAVPRAVGRLARRAQQRAEQRT